MALTYVFFAFVPSAMAVTAAGKVYSANAAGVITGVTPSDALTLEGVGVTLQLMAATGATVDRPNTQPATALTGALNNINPFPAGGLPFHDTTLSKEVYFVGTQRSSTGWVDYTGASA